VTSTPVFLSNRNNREHWPNVGFDVEAVLRNGWQPSALRQFVVKIHSRCNLNCDYCYMYEMADQSWREKPVRMSEATIEASAARIAEHATSHQLTSVSVVFHGGEPLLAGKKRLEFAARSLRNILPADIALDLSVQTNGLLLDNDMLEFLEQTNIHVGISLDGDRQANDRHRRDIRGSGSYERVEQALHRLRQPRYAHLFRRILCTIDLQNDPVETYEALISFGPPSVDFLLPQGNWTQPPPFRDPESLDTPYADWLIAVFDCWYEKQPVETSVRFLDNILQLLLGGQSTVESIGTSRVCLAVVETDGTIEQVDALKSAFHGAPATGLNVFEHHFDEVLEHPAVVVRQLGRNGLSETCRQCPVVDTCGGGYFPHRYRSPDGFSNPSVYCRDLFALIEHIRHRVTVDVDRHIAERA
jgi:uncharacterized protein